MNIRVSLEFGSKNATVFRTREGASRSTVTSRPSTTSGPKPDRSARRLESRSYDFERTTSIEDEDPALEVAKLEEFSANFNAPPTREFVPPLKQPAATARHILRSRKQSDNLMTELRNRRGAPEAGSTKPTGKLSADNKLSPYFDLFASGENLAQKEPKGADAQHSLHPEPKKIDPRSNLIPTNITGQMPLFRMLDDTRGLSGVKRFDQKKTGELKKETFYQPWTTQAMLLSASSEDSTSTTTSPRRITLAQAFALKAKRKKASDGVIKPNKRTLDDRMVEDELTVQIKETTDRIEMFHSLQVQKKVAVNDFCREYSRDLSRFDLRGKSIAQVMMGKTATKSQSQDHPSSQKANLFVMYNDEETEQLARAKTLWVDKEEVRSLKKHIKILSNQKECLVQVKRKVLAQALKNYGKEVNRMRVKDILMSSHSTQEDHALYESKEQQLFGMQSQAVVSQHQKDSLLKPGFLQVQNRIFSLEFVVLELLRCGHILSATDFSCEIPGTVVAYLLEVNTALSRFTKSRASSLIISKSKISAIRNTI